MKIALLIPGMSERAGGVASVVAAHHRMLSQGENIAEIISFEALGKTIYDSIPILKQWRFHPDYLNKITDFHPDIVHCHGIWMYHDFAGWRYASAHNIPLVISPHGMLDPWALGNSRWKKKIITALFESRILRDAACLHALCESEYESIRALGLKNPVAVIPNGFFVPPTPPEKITGHGNRQLLFLSRLHPKKGLVNLLNAFAKIPHENWQLIIAGWAQGGHERELKSLCDTLGLRWIEDTTQNRVDFEPVDVVFVGPKYDADKDLRLRRADGYILPSFSEGLPMAVLEAWSYSLPNIITPQCNLPEAFEAKAAIRVEPDCDSIRKGLQEFFTMDDNELRMTGVRARQLVERQFAWSVIGRQLESVYDWCVNKGDKPDCVRMN